MNTALKNELGKDHSSCVVTVYGETTTRHGLQGGHIHLVEGQGPNPFITLFNWLGLSFI